MELPILPQGMTKRMVAIAGKLSKVQGAGYKVIPLAEKKKCTHISGFKGVKFRTNKKKEEHYIAGVDGKFDVNPYPTHFPGVSPKTRMAFVVDDGEKLEKSLSGAKRGHNREVLASCIDAGYFEIMDKDVEADVLRRAKAIKKKLGIPSPKEETATRKSYNKLSKLKRDRDSEKDSAMSDKVLSLEEENKKMRKQLKEFKESQEAMQEAAKLKRENTELQQKVEDAKLTVKQKTAQNNVAGRQKESEPVKPDPELESV